MRCSVKRRFASSVGGVVLAVLAVLGHAEPAYVRIGSFNIANLGATKEYERSLISLVNIVRTMDADVIAIQEVEPSDLGRAQLARFVDLLNMAEEYYDAEQYDYAVSEEGPGDELTAFLWRAPVTMTGEIAPLDHESDPDGDGVRTFQRVPGVALFKAGNTDFYVVNCHLYTKTRGTTSEGRAEELAAIRAWLEDLADEDEKDALVLGDFNRFLNGKSAWKQVMAPGCERWYRFPLLEAISAEAPGFDPAKDDAPEDRLSTTTSEKRSIYDQILLAAGSYREFTETPVLGVDVGIVDFDNDPHYEWVVGSWYNAIKTLSDHRPIWIRLRIDQPDDD